MVHGYAYWDLNFSSLHCLTLRYYLSSYNFLAPYDRIDDVFSIFKLCAAYDFVDTQ